MSEDGKIKFKIGDTVSLRADPSRQGTIIDIEVKSISCGHMPYTDKYIVRLDDRITSESYYSYSLNLVVDNKGLMEYSNGCECGARFTSEPDLHLRMCPKFKEPM